MSFGAWLNIMCLGIKYASAEGSKSTGCKLGMTECDMLQIINTRIKAYSSIAYSRSTTHSNISSCCCCCCRAWDSVPL
jgi:hypothetical protein